MASEKKKKLLEDNLWKKFAKIFQYHFFFCDLYKKNFKLGSQKSAWMECCGDCGLIVSE